MRVMKIPGGPFSLFVPLCSYCYTRVAAWKPNHPTVSLASRAGDARQNAFLCAAVHSIPERSKTAYSTKLLPPFGFLVPAVSLPGSCDGGRCQVAAACPARVRSPRMNLRAPWKSSRPSEAPSWRCQARATPGLKIWICVTASSPFALVECGARLRPLSSTVGSR